MHATTALFRSFNNPAKTSYICSEAEPVSTSCLMPGACRLTDSTPVFRAGKNGILNRTGVAARLL